MILFILTCLPLISVCVCPQALCQTFTSMYLLLAHIFVQHSKTFYTKKVWWIVQLIQKGSSLKLSLYLGWNSVSDSFRWPMATTRTPGYLLNFLKYDKFMIDF